MDARRDPGQLLLNILTRPILHLVKYAINNECIPSYNYWSIYIWRIASLFKSDVFAAIHLICPFF